MPPLTVTITDTVSIAALGAGWAEPREIAAAFAGQLEERYFSTVTGLYPEAVVEVAVTVMEDALDQDPEVELQGCDLEPQAMEEAILEAIKDLKDEVGQDSLMTPETEREQAEQEEDPE